MLKVAIGHSNDPDSEMAITEVLEQCLEKCSHYSEPPIAGLLLAAIDFDHQMILDRIHETFPNIQLIGGTTDGELSSELQFHQDSLVFTLFCSADLQIQAGVGRHLSQDALVAAHQAIHQAQGKQEQQPKLCLTIPEGMGYDSNSLVEGLKAVLGDNFPIFGGATADQQRFKTCYQFFGREVLTNAAPVFLFYGNVKFSCGIAHGWQPIGKVAKLTQVGQNTIVEIDDQPALDLYDYYLQGLQPSPEYPLAIFEDHESDQFYLRSPIGSDRERGEIAFLTNLPVNTKVQIAFASHDDVLTATQTSFKIARDRYPGEHPEVALIFTCCTRRQILGTRTEEECKWINELSDENLAFAGFYTYGEIGPAETGGIVRLHHESFITLLLGTR
jgi:hypothetical protein